MSRTCLNESFAPSDCSDSAVHLPWLVDEQIWRVQEGSLHMADPSAGMVKLGLSSVLAGSVGQKASLACFFQDSWTSHMAVQGTSEKYSNRGSWKLCGLF